MRVLVVDVENAGAAPGKTQRRGERGGETSGVNDRRAHGKDRRQEMRLAQPRAVDVTFA
jgi:hypothetical protein